MHSSMGRSPWTEDTQHWQKGEDTKGPKGTMYAGPAFKHLGCLEHKATAELPVMRAQKHEVVGHSPNLGDKAAASPATPNP